MIKKNELDIDSIRLSKEYWDEIISKKYDRIALNHGLIEKEKVKVKKKVKIDSKIFNKVVEISQNKDNLIYLIMLSIFKTAISKYFANTEFFIGIPQCLKSNDMKKNNKFIVLDNYTMLGNTFKQVLINVRKEVFEAYTHQFYPLREPYRIVNIYEKVNVYCCMNNIHDMDQIQDILNLDNNEFTLVIEKYDDYIELVLYYFDEVISSDEVNRIIKIFINILTCVIENTEVKLNDIEILSEEEKHKLLVEFNDTSSDYPRDKTIHELFEEQVQKTPNNIAVVFGNRKLSYKELNERANALARTLRKKGVKPDDIVGVKAERSIEMIVGILAILKAGGAYLPIDPDYPEERIRYMLKDSKVNMLLMQNSLINVNTFDCEVLNLADKKVFNKDVGELEVVVNSNNLAYIMYTSGTTGKSKGVEVTQRNIIRLVKNTNYIEFNENDRILQTGSIAFDASTFEIWGALLNGSSLHLVNKEIILNAASLGKYLLENNITILWLTSPLFNKLTEENETIFNNVKYLLVGGDVVSPKHVNLVKKKLEKIVIINGYGPTENTTFSTYYEIEDLFNKGNVIPIGKPISNSTAYILDKNNSLVPIGVPGELCVGGDGLARGYLNNTKLTAEKFVDNPYEPGQRMYKTGDLARWSPDGNIEFLGRIDNQVKIRGFRIELGEIENQLLKNDEIKEVVVVDKEDNDGNKYLCAYIVSEKEITIQELRGNLSKLLPDYMIPSYFIQVEKMPLTPNGKIDRKALPEPDGDIVTGVEYVAPRNEIEEKLVKVWSEILGVEKIGIDDDFFTLGGHSLKAIQIISMIHKELNVEVPVSEVFSNSTIRQLGEYIETARESVYSSIKTVEEREVYRVSSAQKRLFALNQFAKEEINYNIPSVMIVEGKLEKYRVEETFRKLVERHEAFRTSFELVNEEIVQRIHKEVEFKIEYEEISEVKEEVIKGMVDNFIRPFDLSKAPLLRVKLVGISEEKHILMIDMHHIVSDGTTMGILIEEFTKLYKGEELKPLRIQYKDYAAWENELLESEGLKVQEEYWMKVFGDEIPVLNISTDYARPTMQNFEGDSIDFKVNKELAEKIRKISEDNGATMYMTLLSAYTILLSKYSGQEDIIVGSPIAGRSHVDLEGIAGMFVNTLAMRNYPKSENRFKEFLQSVKENALKAYENQDYQFNELVERVQVRRDLSRNPLFNTMFVLQNTGNKGVEIDDLRFEACNFENKISKFDLTLTAIEKNEEIGFSLEYCTKLFKRETVEKLGNHFLNILREIAENEDVKISEIEMLSEEEKKRILVEFNDTAVDYPKDKTIHELFEEQVEKTPDNIAVVFKDKKLTYRELSEKSNSLARVLREKGVKADSIVGIMVERSIEMIIGILAILKAGGAYLPIDSSYPKERVEYILRDSKSKVLLSTEGVLNNVEYYGNSIDLLNTSLFKGDPSNLERINNSHNLAYVIYTSGTTGNPKGVMIKHSNLNNFVNSFTRQFKGGFNYRDRILSLTNYVFDVSVCEFFTALVSGATLIINDKHKTFDSMEIAKLIVNNEITFTYIPPSLLLNVYEELVKCKSKIKLEKLLVGVESIKGEILNKYMDLNRNIEIVNGYGPTESTICSTFYKLIGNQIPNKAVPIGRPIGNSIIYILDKNNSLVPSGVPGELYVGGEGLARGYLNNENLTSEKFIDNPYKLGQKMYKTGDLARWLPDGNIEYVGRIDNQVKIRGFRIELGEIESILSKIEGVKETVVLDKEKDGNKYLCAYYISEKEYSIGQLREELKKSLPDYMVPSYFIKLETMPLTANGKINRKALPEPRGKIDTGAEYEAPKSELEKKLVEIWETVLGVESIGVNDDFFQLGGDSIKSIQVISRAKALGYSFEVKDLFNNPNIKDLSRCVKQNTLIIEQGEVEGEVELTPIQKWFFEMDFEEKHHWNQAVMLFSKDGFEEELVEKAFKSIVIHHDALRMICKNEDNEMHQINRGSYGKLYDLSIYDYRDAKAVDKNEIKEICSKIQGSISLEEGPLVKLGLFKTNEGDHLLIAVHHLVIDGVSWRILFEDLERAYTTAKKGEEIILQEKTTSFKKWAREQKKYADTYDIKKQLEYWNSIEKQDIKKLPKDKEADKSIVNDVSSLGLELTQEETENLLKNVNNTYNTEINDILLAALAITISKWTSDENILVNLESHGREEIIKNVDITRTIGWFTSQYPVVLKVDNEDLAMMIKNTKDSLRRIPNKGIGYGIIKYLSENEFKDKIEFKLKPEICFNYLGQFDEDITNDVFSMSLFDMGNSLSMKNKNIYSLDFSGILVDKRLRLDIRYSNKEYTEETIKLLISNYKSNLIKIINHCLSKKGKEKTAADVTKENISLYELNPYLKDINNIKDIYPLAPMQEGMLYHALADKESEAYNEELLIKIKGQLDINILEESFNRLLERHDVLRTVFDYESFNKNMQIVFKERKTNIRYEDISKEEFDKEAYIREIIEEYKKKGFNLNKDVLIKLTIIKTGTEEYNLILSNHHIIMDGWCLGIIVFDLFKIYNELKYGYKAELQEVVPYSNYIEWLNSKDKGEAKEYWANYLLGYTESTLVPFKNNETEREYKKGEVNFVIEKDITKQLEEIAISNKVTVNTIMQSVWSILLQKYNNSNDSVFGYVVSGRNPEVKGIENMLGLFINTIPLRVKVEDKMTFKELLNSVNNSFLGSSEYDFYPLAEIQALSEVKENLINNIMVFENYPIDSEGINDEILKKNDLKIIDVNSGEQTNYNFNVIVTHQDKVAIKFNFNEALYSKGKVLRIKEYFENIIKQIISNEKISIKDIEILSEEEKHKLLVDFNDTKVEYPKDKTIYELFEEQAEKTPDNIAVVFEDEKLTYKELNERANALARTLRGKGVGSDTIVAIMLERSIEMIVGILAILKAGGAYLPIDPNYPKQRIEYMLEDSRTHILLTVDNLLGNIKFSGETINLLDKKLFEGDISNLEMINSPNDLIYVIYTSGTTGNAKGTIVKHHSFTNLMKWYSNEFKISKKDNVLLLASVSFDLAQKNIYAPLIVGGTLTLANKGIINYEKVNKIINENKITIINCAPSAFNPIIELNKDKNFKGLKSLKHVFLGGEAINIKQLSKWMNSENYYAEIINTYGPTECTDIATFYRIKNPKDNSVPIGKPINNVKLYILSEEKQVLPIGMIGEIYISGEGVSRGYLNNEKMTTEKFVENPYEPGQKMYKTGDLGRWLPDGNIEFLGRIDHQVKIRGFRIELGEIESNLLKIEGVKEAVVLDKDKEGNKYLCAYYVSEIGYSIGELREALKNSLPDYMVPSYFIKLETIPLTPNGKVDRKALPEPEGDIETGAEYEAPRNEIEEKLVEIWKGVLDVSNIGINDDFFELGGHSLNATILVGRIHKELNVEVPLKEIFRVGNIKGLSEYILFLDKKEYEAIEKVEEKEYYEASSAQKRMYMLQQFDKDSVAYNIPAALEILGELNIERLKEVVIRLIERHEALRTSFYVKEGMVLQRVHSLEEINFNIVEMNVQNEEEIEEKIKELVRPFNLEQVPLLRISIIRLEKARQVMLFDMHHIISDGTSMSILTNEFSQFYMKKELEELKVQYRDYSAWQLKRRESEEFKKQEEYWLKEFSGEIPVLSLPTDYTRPKVKNFKGDTISFTLNKETTENLRRIAKENGITMYMMLLANLKILLSKYSGQEDIIIGSPIAGRNHRDLENIIGVFVNTLAIRSTVDNELSFEEYLKVIKEKSLKAYENQDYQFEEIVEKLDVDRDLSRNPLFDVMLVLQNMEEAKIELEDLAFKPYVLKNNTEKFDITINAIEGNEEISFNLSYATSIFEKGTIESMIKCFEYIMKLTSSNPNIIINDINLIVYDEVYDFLTNANDKDLHKIKLDFEF